VESRIPEILDIQHIIPEFLSLAAKGTNDHAKKQVTYASIINDYRQLTASPSCNEQMNHTCIHKDASHVSYIVCFSDFLSPMRVPGF
jgi:hypothetical protein